MISCNQKVNSFTMTLKDLNKLHSFMMKTDLVLFKVRYAGVCVYRDITGCENLGMDCSALAICLIGMLDDVYLHGKLGTTYNMKSQVLKILQPYHMHHFIDLT